MINARIEKLRNKITELGANAMFISNFYNILYFFGFETLTENEREAFGLVTQNSLYILTDARYQPDESRYHVCLFEPGKSLSYYLQEICAKEQISSLIFESDDLRYYEYSALIEKVKSVTFIPTFKIGENIREIKDDDEITKIKKACEITDTCLEAIVGTIKEGQTEKEIAFNIEVYLKKNGHDLAFDPIVAIDANSAIAHYNTKTGSGLVKKGSTILIDFGAKTENYLSDITRMIFFGKPKDSTMKIYMSLLSTQENTLKVVENINMLKEIDLYCRSEIKKNGLPDFPHSTGHGVGLEIHEHPKVSYASEDKKKEGQIITIEPGVYVANQYGMRIEDTVVIENGKAKPLTLFSKAPFILD